MMLKKGPNFVPGRPKSSRTPEGTLRASVLPAASLDDLFEHQGGE